MTKRIRGMGNIGGQRGPHISNTNLTHVLHRWHRGFVQTALRLRFDFFFSLSSPSLFLSTRIFGFSDPPAFPSEPPQRGNEKKKPQKERETKPCVRCVASACVRARVHAYLFVNSFVQWWRCCWGLSIYIRVLPRPRRCKYTVVACV